MFPPSGVSFPFNFARAAHALPVVPSSPPPPLPAVYFQAKKNESAPPPRLCSFWHPTKLIASAGIGLEGLVLFWHFFQEWPSITWSIVLVMDLSLLDPRLVAEWCADATEVLKVCRVHHNLGEKTMRWSFAAFDNDIRGFFFFLNYCFVSGLRWPHPKSGDFGRLCFILIFSPVIMPHRSSPSSLKSSWCKTMTGSRLILFLLWFDSLMASESNWDELAH